MAVVMSKYYSARVIMRRKLINNEKIAYINIALDNMLLLINTNRDTFGWINSDGISKLFDIPLQKGVSNTRINENIKNVIQEIHDRNSFYSCLR